MSKAVWVVQEDNVYTTIVNRYFLHRGGVVAIPDVATADLPWAVKTLCIAEGYACGGWDPSPEAP